MSEANKERAERARIALKAYVEQFAPDEIADTDGQAVYLIADLYHLFDEDGIRREDVLERADVTYDGDQEDED